MELSLTELQSSAWSMGFHAWIDDLAGGLVGLHLKHGSGPLFLVTLDGGREEGSSWCVGLADGSDDSGELPVSSDADQTLRDALAWMSGERSV